MFTVSDPDSEIMIKPENYTSPDTLANLSNVLMDFMDIQSSQVTEEAKKAKVIKAVEKAFGTEKRKQGKITKEARVENIKTSGNVLNTVEKKLDFYHLFSEPVYGCIKY